MDRIKIDLLKRNFDELKADTIDEIKLMLLSQASEITGLHEQYLSNFTNNKIVVTMNKVIKIAESLSDAAEKENFYEIISK